VRSPASDSVVRQPLAEWQAEMERRGKLDCKFVCPRCGNVATPSDFEALGVSPERAAQECIGRVRPAKMAGGEFDAGPDGGCDWAAYGLFRGPNFVVLPDGSESPVFAFAEPGICDADEDSLRAAQCRDDEIAQHLRMHAEGRCPTRSDADAHEYRTRLDALRGRE
jgi:hypothetical protein